MEVSLKRNAMLHSQPGIDSHDPQQRLRLLRWKVSALPSETHMISDEWLDDFIRRIGSLRVKMMAARPQPPGAE